MGGAPLQVDVHLTAGELRAALVADVHAGLTARPKAIPPVWFYDEAGSQLFEEITRLPEYYPTRAERRLLQDHADDIAKLTGSDTLVELGAGACDKTRLLLNALGDHSSLRSYVPFDVSDEFLRAAAGGLVDDYPGLVVHAVVGDFHRHLDRIPTGGRRLVAFLGGTVGNLAPAARHRFFTDLRRTMAPGDHLLVGADLVKERSRIVAAYDDSAGLTAAFNRNVLHVLNRELGAHFDADRFEHVVRWSERDRWIEMHLCSTARQQVPIDDLGLWVEFDEGEHLLTEISARFTTEGLVRELSDAGFVVEALFGAEEGEFLLGLAHPRA